jgi:hypothetical protein
MATQDYSELSALISALEANAMVMPTVGYLSFEYSASEMTPYNYIPKPPAKKRAYVPEISNMSGRVNSIPSTSADKSKGGRRGATAPASTINSQDAKPQEPKRPKNRSQPINFEEKKLKLAGLLQEYRKRLLPTPED